MQESKLRDLLNFYAQLDHNLLLSRREVNSVPFKFAEKRKEKIWSIIEKRLDELEKK